MIVTQNMEAEKDKDTLSYRHQRLQTLGIDPDAEIRVPDYKGRWKQVDPEYKKWPLFESDDQDNICINYFSVYGNRRHWKNGKSNSLFVRKRLKNPKEDFKYYQPKGSGQHPYFPPGIIMKFHDEEEIETLIVTEGEFKSIKGDLHGLDIVGLPSIHGFYDNEGVKGDLHPELKKLIEVCRVKTLIFLVDADILSIKYAEGKDLSKRQTSFYSSVKNLREGLQPFIDSKDFALQNIIFSHIKSSYSDTAKGLDDLLVLRSGEMEIETVKSDLLKGVFSIDHFKGFNITQTQSLKKVYSYLGLNDEKSFYETYKDFIDGREFIFKNRKYEYDPETGEVKFVRHQDADKFLRIGPNWFKQIGVPNKYGELEENLIPWNITEINRDYKKFPSFIDQINKYDAFCNEPNWGSRYNRIHNNCYNITNPLQHKIAEGDFPNTAKFLKHLFQGSGNFDKDITGDIFTVALDYLTIMLQHPKQMLPVPVLVSPEYRTGKSTFLKWLQAIFGNNCAILGNEQFKMKFNAHYITKFIIGIDEGFLEVDKKSEKERIKQLATADTVYLENKGHDVKKIPYYGKLIICSNDADRVMKIDEGENRWFVVKVPTIPDELVDPDLEAKMKAEIPAWLHFLFQRKIHHPKEDRLWFTSEHFITPQFKVIVEYTKNRVDKVFENWIKDLFLTYKIPVLRFPLSDLTEAMNDVKKSKYKVDEIELKTYLKDRKGLSPIGKVTRCKMPTGWRNEEENPFQDPEIVFYEKPGRPYEFKAEEWLNEEEMAEFNNPFDWKEDGR